MLIKCWLRDVCFVKYHTCFVVVFLESFGQENRTSLTSVFSFKCTPGSIVRVYKIPVCFLFYFFNYFSQFFHQFSFSILHLSFACVYCTWKKNFIFILFCFILFYWPISFFFFLYIFLTNYYFFYFHSFFLFFFIYFHCFYGHSLLPFPVLCRAKSRNSLISMCACLCKFVCGWVALIFTFSLRLTRPSVKINAVVNNRVFGIER